MNLTRMIESLEIFQKYETSGDEEYLPLDTDYGIITGFLQNTFMAATDVNRLKELGWEVHQSPSYGNDVRYIGQYEINKTDKGTYEFYLHL